MFRKQARLALAVMLAGTLMGCAGKDPFEPGRNDVPARILPETQTSAAVQPPPWMRRKSCYALHALDL